MHSAHSSTRIIEVHTQFTKTTKTESTARNSSVVNIKYFVTKL